MNLSSWAIRSPIPTILLFLILSFAGFKAFHAMKVQNVPDMDLPTVSVSASLPGAAPPQLETEVARKLENAVATLQGVKNLYTKILDGQVSLASYRAFLIQAYYAGFGSMGHRRLDHGFRDRCRGTGRTEVGLDERTAVVTDLDAETASRQKIEEAMYGRRQMSRVR